MRNNTFMRLVMTAALLIVAVPAIASAQIYNRYDYDRSDRRDVRDAIARLDSAGARLQSDLNYGNERRVLGGLLSFRTVDNDAIAQVRDFRRAVRDLRSSSRSGFALERSVDEARIVLDRGVQLDRYLRLRTGRTSVDADLADIRSNLHLIADAYNLSVPY
jgi:biopolymer transport protein ExbB/TolQ